MHSSRPVHIFILCLIFINTDFVNAGSRNETSSIIRFNHLKSFEINLFSGYQSWESLRRGFVPAWRRRNDLASRRWMKVFVGRFGVILPNKSWAHELGSVTVYFNFSRWISRLRVYSLCVYVELISVISRWKFPSSSTSANKFDKQNWRTQLFQQRLKLVVRC